VFKELRRCMTGYPLKAWIKKAGIQKHLIVSQLKIENDCFFRQ